MSRSVAVPIKKHDVTCYGLEACFSIFDYTEEKERKILYELYELKGQDRGLPQNAVIAVIQKPGGRALCPCRRVSVILSFLSLFARRQRPSITKAGVSP